MPLLRHFYTITGILIIINYDRSIIMLCGVCGHMRQNYQAGHKASLVGREYSSKTRTISALNPINSLTVKMKAGVTAVAGVDQRSLENFSPLDQPSHFQKSNNPRRTTVLPR